MPHFLCWMWLGAPIVKHGHIVRDVHPGSHFIPRGWIARQLDELLGLPPSYP
ncbi:MAG: hypothetical protein ACU0AX_10460 [Roseovarius sp.]|uniref:hypothetical protein n=1 Tax=Roseovarius sp. TaxID=1486281 RepID=UPI00405A2971